MALTVQIVVDCEDADRLAEFWAISLDYRLEPPPEGFADWPSFLEANNLPVPPAGSINAVIDPAGAGPRVLFPRVPEPKIGKNRVHIDVRAGEDRAAKVAQLVDAGATVVQRVAERGQSWVVMADPEGNEFCVT
jgi:hypothetical protein